MIPKTLKLATIPLRISSILYLLVAVLGFVFLFAGGDDCPPELAVIMGITWLFTAAMSIGMIVFIEIVIKALKNGKYWAWIAGLCLAGLYISSAFLLLGVFMLIGLLKDDTKKHCSRKPEPTA